jgi:hypothetical protein
MLSEHSGRCEGEQNLSDSDDANEEVGGVTCSAGKRTAHRERLMPEGGDAGDESCGVRLCLENATRADQLTAVNSERCKSHPKSAIRSYGFYASPRPPECDGLPTTAGSEGCRNCRRTGLKGSKHWNNDGQLYRPVRRDILDARRPPRRSAGAHV